MIPILRLLRAAGSDRDLLDRYVRNRDGAAFEALVCRYGTGVWAACVRLAGRDAEDAFQATFLIRKAEAVPRPESVGDWLYGVARQTAVRMRALAARRAVRE